MPQLALRYGALSSAGGRSMNQDAHRVVEGGDGAWCALLADGLGGHGGGEVASGLVAQAVTEAFQRAPEVSPDAAHALAQEAHERLRARQRESPELERMRTTLVLLLLDPETGSAAWLHIGDSRLYWLRDGRLRHQTLDHSVPQAMVAAGELDARGIRQHEDRNRLLRSLGHEELRPDVSPLQRVQAGDAFLLCSDGFWDYVYEPEIEVDYAKALTPDGWLGHMHERLLLRADDPEHDNYSAVALFVEPAAS